MGERLRTDAIGKILRLGGFTITSSSFRFLFHSNSTEYVLSDVHCRATNIRQMCSAPKEQRRVTHIQYEPEDKADRWAGPERRSRGRAVRAQTQGGGDLTSRYYKASWGP